jgi:hypothetical protein
MIKSKFDMRPIDLLVNEEIEKTKRIGFKRPKPDEIIELYHKIDKKYTEIADTEILELINVFAKFYVLMDPKEKIIDGKRTNKTNGTYAIEKLNHHLGRLAKREDAENPKSRIMESLFKKEIKKYKESLELTYKHYKSNVINGARDRLITSEDIRCYIQNYTP